MSGDADMEISRDGTREDIPAEVIGGNISLDQTGKVVEGSGRAIDQVDVYDHNKVNRDVWVKSCFKLMIAVYEFDDFCLYRRVHMVRVKGKKGGESSEVIPVWVFQITIGKDHLEIGGGDVGA